MCNGPAVYLIGFTGQVFGFKRKGSRVSKRTASVCKVWDNKVVLLDVNNS